MAVEALNEPIRLEATVVEGFGRGGKQLGCPTANLSSKDLGDQLEELPTGIYCGWATVDGKGPFKAVASIGWNPYFKNKEKTVEPHLLHKFEEDFYGSKLKYVIVGYLRPEKDFASLEALVEAIQDDISQSEAWLDTPEGKAWTQDALFQKLAVLQSPPLYDAEDHEQDARDLLAQVLLAKQYPSEDDAPDAAGPLDGDHVRHLEALRGDEVDIIRDDARDAREDDELPRDLHGRAQRTVQLVPTHAQLLQDVAAHGDHHLDRRAVHERRRVLHADLVKRVRDAPEERDQDHVHRALARVRRVQREVDLRRERGVLCPLQPEPTQHRDRDAQHARVRRHFAQHEERDDDQERRRERQERYGRRERRDLDAAVVQVARDDVDAAADAHGRPEKVVQLRELTAGLDHRPEAEERRLDEPARRDHCERIHEPGQVLAQRVAERVHDRVDHGDRYAARHDHLEFFFVKVSADEARERYPKGRGDEGEGYWTVRRRPEECAPVGERGSERKLSWCRHAARFRLVSRLSALGSRLLALDRPAFDQQLACPLPFVESERQTIAKLHDCDSMDVNDAELLPLRMGRSDVKRRVIHVSREPLAFATLLQKSARCADALVLTSTSDRSFQHVNLQLEIQEGVLSEIPHQIVLRGLQLALQWSLEYLDDEDCPVRIPIDWSDRTSVNAIVRGIISAKSASGLSGKDLQETVLRMVVEAFVAMYDHIAQNPSEPIPARFLYQPGLKSMSKSQLWKNSVFLDFPWPQGYPLEPIANAKLALFNITTDPSRDENPSGDTTTEHSSSKDVFRLEALRDIGDTLHRLGVTALMSQKIIPRYLQMYLAGKGVFVLDRLSINHIHAVHQLSGAVVLGDWQVANVDQSSFGFLSLITTHEICGKRYIRLQQESTTAHGSRADLPAAASGRSSPVSTIVLTAPDKYAFEELSYTMETALKRLAALAERPDAVAGAGCMEIRLASLLHEKAELLRLPPTSEKKMKGKNAHDSRDIRQLRQVVQAFADCLIKVVASLGHCTTSNEEREILVEKLQVANLQESKQTELFGWDPSERRAVPVVSYLQSTDSNNSEPFEKQVLRAHVLDSYPAKRDALVLAVECACSIARIASVVKVS